MSRFALQRQEREEAQGAIDHVYRYMTERQKVEIWLSGGVKTRIRGVIRGFDEWMNFVLEQAEEVEPENGDRTQLGRILLKGDTVLLMRPVDE